MTSPSISPEGGTSARALITRRTAILAAITTWNFAVIAGRLIRIEATHSRYHRGSSRGAGKMRPATKAVRFVGAVLATSLLLSGCVRFSGGLFGFGPGGLYAPIDGDSRPHSGVDPARALPVQGIDVARYQENVDFAIARVAGVQFVFMKATEGRDYIDPSFERNWRRARDAGMPRGAYHFMNWCSSAEQQAAWFEKMVPADWDALPPVLDLEWQNGSRCKDRGTRAETLANIRLILARWSGTQASCRSFTQTSISIGTF